MLCGWVSGSWYFGVWCLYHHGLGSHQDEGIAVLWVPGTTHPMSHCYIPECCSLQKHRCENPIHLYLMLCYAFVTVLQWRHLIWQSRMFCIQVCSDGYWAMHWFECFRDQLSSRFRVYTGASVNRAILQHCFFWFGNSVKFLIIVPSVFMNRCNITNKCSSALCFYCTRLNYPDMFRQPNAIFRGLHVPRKLLQFCL
jgi:hypothetical protein